jgi:uncharacterized protein (TIGR03083 family)
MIIDRNIDCGASYRRKRHELIDLLRTLSDKQLRKVVPATPAWSVHDVVSHLVGITADLNAGNFGSSDPDDWTATQVRKRRSRSIEDLGAEWEKEGPTFEEGLRLLGYGIGSHYVGDLVQHTADIYHALRRKYEDDEALIVGLDFYLDSCHETLTTAGVGAVAVRILDDEWVLGRGTSVATLTAGRFEAFRCLGGRRSERQIRGMDWTGDLDTILRLLSRYPLPSEDLVEA